MNANPTYWTLEYDGVETNFGQLGLAEPKLHLESQGKGTFTVSIPPKTLLTKFLGYLGFGGAMSLLLDPPVPYFGQVVIRRYMLGDPTQGQVIFQGRQIRDHRTAQPDGPVETITFADAWHDLANLVYQQEWNFRQSNGTIYYSQPTCRVNLFQQYSGSSQYYTLGASGTGYKVGDVLTPQGGTLQTGASRPTVQVSSVNSSGGVTSITVGDGTAFSVAPATPAATTGGSGVGCTITINSGAAGGPMSAGAQVGDILTWAGTCGVLVSTGTVNLPWILPVYPAKGLMCAAALQLCLKPQVDAVCWLDYFPGGTVAAPTVPAMSVTQRPGLSPITLPWADGVMHRSSEITARYDLQADQVVLQYAKPQDVNGVSQNSFAVDAWPVGSQGKAVGALVVPLELAGSRLQTQQAFLSSVPVGALSLGWWENVKPELKTYSNVAFYVGAAQPTYQITDSNGNVATLQNGVLTDPANILGNYPNALTDGQVQPWMAALGTVADNATIQARFTYQEETSGGVKAKEVSPDGYVVSTKITLTNAPAGVAVPYSNVTSSDWGESMIPGLAQNIWNSLQPLAFDGSHSIYEENAMGYPEAGARLGFLLSPRYALNLSGGRAEWATMNATIQSVDIDFTRGYTDITFGPPKHIAPGDLAELLQFWRYRWSPVNLQTRQTGLT